MTTYLEKKASFFYPSGDPNPLRLQRLDGRLKNYNSCFDSRAWNPDEKIRHDHLLDWLSNAGSNMPLGQVVPVDILIDTLVKNRLETLEKTLEAYQKLILTENQEELLHIYMEEAFKGSYQFGLSKTMFHDQSSSSEPKIIPQLISIKTNSPDSIDNDQNKSWSFPVVSFKKTDFTVASSEESSRVQTPTQFFDANSSPSRCDTPKSPISLLIRENIENLLPLSPHDQSTNNNFVSENPLRPISPRRIVTTSPRSSSASSSKRMSSNPDLAKQDLPIIPEESLSRKSESDFENNRIKELHSTSNPEDQPNKLCICGVKCAAIRSHIANVANRENRLICSFNTCDTKEDSDTEEVTDFSDEEVVENSTKAKPDVLMEMVIEKDSQIIALNNELAALKLELQEKTKLTMEVVQKLEAIYNQTLSKENLIQKLSETEAVVQAVKETFPEVPLDLKHQISVEKIDTETAQFEQLQFEVEAMNRFCSCIAKAHMDMNNEYEKLREINEQLLSELTLEKMQIDQLDSEKIEKLVNDDDQYATMDELNTLQSENLKLRTEIVELNGKISMMATKLEDLEHMQMLLSSVDEYPEQIAKLEKQLEEYKEKTINSEKLACELEKYKCEFEELSVEYKEMSKQFTEMRIRVVDFDFLKAERDTFMKQLDDYQNVSEELQRLKCCEKLLVRMQHENEETKKKLNLLQVFETKYTECREKLKERDDTIESLEKEVQKSKSKVDYLMNETDQIQMRSTEALTALRNEIEQKNNKILCYEDEMEKLQVDIEELQRYLMYAIDLLDEKKINGDKKKVTSKALTEDYKEVCEAVNEIERELSDLKIRTSTTESLSTKVLECQNHQKVLGQKLNFITNEFELICGVINDNEKLAATVSTLCQTVEELQTKNRELEGKTVVRLDASVSTVDDTILENCTCCQEVIENDRRQIQVLMLENGNLLTEIKIWQSKLAELDNKLDELIEENKQLIEEREHLRQNRHFKELFEESREAIITLTHQLTESKYKNMEIKKSNSILQNELEKIKSVMCHPNCTCIDVSTDCCDLNEKLKTTSDASTAIEPHDYYNEIDQLTVTLENQMRNLAADLQVVALPKRVFSHNSVQTENEKNCDILPCQCFSSQVDLSSSMKSIEAGKIDDEIELLKTQLENRQRTIEFYKNELEKYKDFSKWDVVTLKQQYDRDLAHILSKHDESVTKLQQMHEDAMQEAQREFEQEADSLREQLGELYRKIDQFESQGNVAKKALNISPVETINIPCKCDEKGKISLRLVKKILELIDEDVAKCSNRDKTDSVFGLNEEQLYEKIQILQKKLLLKKEQMQNQISSLKSCLEKEQKRIIQLREELDGERKRVCELQSSFENLEKPKSCKAIAWKAQENRARVAEKISNIKLKSSKICMK